MTELSGPQARPSLAEDDDDSAFALFARQAADTPDAIALRAEDATLSYAALAARAADFCRELRARGVAPGQAVGVLMSRRADLVAVLLGIWQAGAAYVPFDPREPGDRLRRMLRSARCRWLIGDAALLPALTADDAAAAAGEALGCIDAAQVPTAPPGTALPIGAVRGANLAYLLFTSGSTGEPKAVKVEHAQVAALLHTAAAMLRFGPADRVLAASTIAFDASVTELFLPLATGAAIVLRDRDILLEPRRLVQTLRAEGVTVFQTGPAVWATVLAETSDFPHLRVAITHGEAVAPELTPRIARCADEAWNLYGPTETTVWATGHRLAAAPATDGAPVPIGRPLAHVRVRVVDAAGHVLGDGEGDGTEGELCIGGPGVARGYRGLDALTAERFVTIDGERFYRSGDLVRRDPDGLLHCLGRNDEQMKLRGVRVEPGEVEAALRADARVAQAAVTWFDTAAGTRAIVAAVVLQPGAACSAEALHDALRLRLPGPMIPARYLFVPWLPLTTSGKIDRQALRRRVAEGAAPAAPPAPALPQLQGSAQRIAEVWRRMLGEGELGPDTNFFAAGGDSLAAVQTMVEIEAQFGVQLPVHLLFEAPTLAELARRVDRECERRADEPAADFVFPVVQRDGGTPMFFVGVNLVLAHPGAWTLPCPLYAVVNWARGSGFVRAESLAALAAAHLAGVRRVQPQGPYRLAGFSLGALIALEMARQLRAAGDEVELLFLLDPMEPRATRNVDAPWQASPPPTLHRRAGRYLAKLTAGPGEAGWRAWLAAAFPVGRIPLVEWLGYVLINQYARRPNPALRLLLPRNRWRAFWFAARRMVEGYVAEPYAGRTLAVFSDAGQRYDNWRRLLVGPEADLRTTGADHHAMFDEAVRAQWLGWLGAALGQGWRRGDQGNTMSQFSGDPVNPADGEIA